MNGAPSDSTRASKADVEERVEKAEELLCAGLSPGRVERRLADEFSVSERQARKYIGRVYKRWQAQTALDAPHRREKTIRMAERFYAKALVEKQFTAAANVLGLLAKMSGAFTAQEPHRDSVLKTLGPIPDDPTLALVWAQKAMLLALAEVVANPAIDPERRLRLISDLGGKIGMTHAKALVEAKLDRVAERLIEPPDATDELEADTTPWPATSRLGSGDAGEVPLRRPGAEDPASEDR